MCSLLDRSAHNLASVRTTASAFVGGVAACDGASVGRGGEGGPPAGLSWVDGSGEGALLVWCAQTLTPRCISGVASSSRLCSGVSATPCPGNLLLEEELSFVPVIHWPLEVLHRYGIPQIMTNAIQEVADGKKRPNIQCFLCLLASCINS